MVNVTIDDASKTAKAEHDEKAAVQAAERKAQRAEEAKAAKAAKAATKGKTDTQRFGILMEIVICIVLQIPCANSKKVQYQDDESKAEIERMVATYGEFIRAHMGDKGLQHSKGTHDVHDFLSISDENPFHVSVKTNTLTKSAAKISPSVIGQSRKNACAAFRKTHPDEFTFEMSDDDLKRFMATKQNVPAILTAMLEHTFVDRSSMLYVRENAKNKYACFLSPRLGASLSAVQWDRWGHGFEFTHEKRQKNSDDPSDGWDESTTLKVRTGAAGSRAKSLALAEWQFHTKRNNLKMRWNFSNLVDFLRETHLDVHEM
jgi:hypothetical protein